MPTTIVPFAGVHYHPGVVPDLSTVMTPPYDVISATERARYLAQSPHSMIHLILGAEYPSDTEDDNRFTRAAATLGEWRRTGVLQQQRQPALYLYQQTFTLGETPMTRTGFIGRVRLEDYEARVIFPHETTFAGPKADLLRLWDACQANLSQIFAVYLDQARQVEAAFATTLARPPDLTVPHWGEGQHRLWVVTEPAVIAQVQQAMRDKPLVIADGHHRYETALALRDVLRERSPHAPGTAPSDYVMMYYANTYDPGLVALPTHRLVQHLPIPQLEAVLQGLGDWVRVEACPRQGAGESLLQWQERLEGLLRERQGRGSTFALYAGGERCFLVTIPAAAALQHVQYAGASAAWKQLDVSVLHYALLPALQACLPTAQPAVTYARAGDAVLQAVADGGDLAVLMNPTPLEQMVTIAMDGERMPPKSTYFYPKLPTGLVINCFS